MPPAIAQPYAAAGYGGADPAAAAPNPTTFAAASAQPPPFEAPPQQQNYDGLPPAEGAPGANANGARLSVPYRYCSCFTAIMRFCGLLLHHAGIAGVL